MKLLLSLPILFLFFSSTSCEQQLTEQNLVDNFVVQFLFVFTSILITDIVRHVLLYLECAIPYSVFNIFFGLLWGIASLYSPRMAKMVDVCESLIDNFQELILPVMIFTTTFSLDLHAFEKSLAQLMIISFPICMGCAWVIGLMMRQVFETNWTIAEGFLFGLMFSSTYPTDVMRHLEETSLDVKKVANLLEGEAILSAVTAVTLFKLVYYYSEGYVIRWYQIVMGFIRFIFMGIPLGSLFGFLSTSMMKLAFNDVNSLMILSIAACYLSYFLGEYIISSGIITNLMTALALGRERHSLCRENEEALLNLWKLISFMFESIFLIATGVMLPVYINSHRLDMNIYFIVLVTYLVVNIVRFIGFFIFSPLLSRVGYGISFQNMLVCVWGGLKSPLGIALAWKFVEFNEKTNQKQLFFFNVTTVYILMILINASFLPVLFRAIGLADISVTKQLNMSNCMRTIYETRMRLVTVLKMDRLLSDTNWPLVMSFTAIKHPYRKLIQTENEANEENNEEQEDYLIEYGFTCCPECRQNIPNEPTAKEMREMTKEAKMRLLKHKKTTYSRQYESGMLSKEGARILQQAVETAMDSNNLVIELDGLFEMFSKRNWCLQLIRNTFFTLLRTKSLDYKMPVKKYKRFCYRLIHTILFSVFLHIIILLNMAIIAYDFQLKRKYLAYDFIIFKVMFAILYIAEFGVKLAVCHVNNIKQALRMYFRIKLNWLDFLVSFIYIIYGFAYIIYKFNFKRHCDLWVFDLIMNLLLPLRLIRILLYFKFGVLLSKIITALSHYLSVMTDQHKALAFEIGRSIVTGEAHVLKNIKRLIVNDKLRNKLREKSEIDRTVVTRKLGVVQIESPWVTTRVKTRMAVRTILNTLKIEIKELKVSGWVDDFEYHKLLISLAENDTNMSLIKTVEPSSPTIIFREQSYMGGNTELINFLYENISTRKFDPGNIVYQQGEVVEGIYILITGIFKMIYEPLQSVSDRLKNFGCLPVMEHVGGIIACERRSIEYIPSGSSMGELSAISGRPYDGYVIAEKHSEVYFLNRDLLKKGMELDNDPISGFKSRIWKKLFFHKAVAVLLNVPQYRAKTQLEVKYIIERSFIPDLSNFKVFVVNEMIQDLILMHGMATDYDTKEVFIAPCYIPRNVQKLVLPANTLIDEFEKVETKFVVIPAKDCDKYEIMLTEENVCDLVNDDPTISIHYFIEESMHKWANQGNPKKIKKKNRFVKITSKEKSKLSLVSSALNLN